MCSRSTSKLQSKADSPDPIFVIPQREVQD
jgi:hypothetical protein